MKSVKSGITRPVLKGGMIESISFEGEDLSNLLSGSVYFRLVSFERAVLVKANFIGSEFKGVSFAFADLRRARFDATNAYDCDFRGADVRGALLPGKPEEYAHHEGMIYDETTEFEY